MTIPRKTSFLAWQSITIPANSKTSKNQTGSRFIVKEATGKFYVGLDSEKPVPIEPGLGIHLQSGDQFTAITFVNDSATDIVVEYYVGSAEVKDSRLNTLVERLGVVTVRNPDTYPKSQYNAALAAGATATISGLNGANKRKQIIITNRDAAAELDLQDASANYLEPLFAGQKWTVDSSATFKIKNSTGAPVSLAVTGIFYS
jgi:hypothetical protein